MSSTSSSVDATIAIDHATSPGPEEDGYSSEEQDDNRDFGSGDEFDHDPFEGLGQVLITEEGETLVDVIASIRDLFGERNELHVQTNKILYKIAKALETKKD
jgi:hypothetical protein